MAVLGRLLVSSAERLDLPDLLSLDSYAAGDWKYFLKSLVGDTRPYILKGFDVIDPENAIGTQSCSIRVADSITYYPGSNAGAFYHGLPEGNTRAVPLVPELRKNAVNYVYLTFSTFNTSVDTRAFWDPDKDGGVGGEFTQDVDTESVLEVQVNVSTGSFPVNTVPVAKVTVGAVVITAIEDARDLMFRLGTGGISPDPFNTYSWRSLPSSPYQRAEPPTQMTAGGVNPFQGADKNILTLKEWMDAVMSKLRELGGSTYWYEDVSTFNVINSFLDAVAVTFKSKGKWVHDTVTPGTLTWTEDIQIKMTSDPRTYIVRQGSKPMNDEQVMYIDMVRNQQLNGSDQPVSWTNGQAYVNTVGGAIGLFANLSQGDYVKKLTDSFDKWRRVEEFYDAVNLGGSTTTAANARSIRLDDVYLGSTGVEKGRYDKGSYTIGDVVVSDRDDAAIATAGGNFHWLALRSDTIENTSNIVSHSLALAISEHDGSTAKVVSVTHNLVDGDRITITGTTNFNGTYRVEVETNSIFYITKTGGPFANESGTGRYATVTTAARSTPYGFPEESANHGFNSDDTIIISGTTNYNNSYLIKVRNATTFTIPIPATFATETSGLATLARIIVRSEGAGFSLIQGQVIDIGGSIADNIRQYIGMDSLSQTTPNYAIAPGYNTLDGMQDYNGTVGENLTSRASKLTAMMADKAQDKTVKYNYGTGLTTVTNTTNGAAQEVTFDASGSVLNIVLPGSTGSAAVTLPSSMPGVSLLVNQVAYVTVNRNAPSTPTISVANISSLAIDENIFVILTRLSGTDVYLWDGRPIPVGPYVLEKADRDLGNLTSPTRINQNLNADQLTTGTNREIGDLVPFSIIRGRQFSSENVSYTLTGDFTNGSNLVTNIVGTFPAYDAGAFKYALYSPNIPNGANIIISFDSPTQVTLPENAISSQVGATFTLVPTLDITTDDQTGTDPSGLTFLRSGRTVDGLSGFVGIGSGNASGTGDSGVIYVYSGDAAGGDSGNTYVGTGLAGGTRGNVILDAQAIDANNSQIINLADPTSAIGTDAANQRYVDRMGGAQSVAAAGGTTTLVESSPHFTVVTGTLSQTYDLPTTAVLEVGNEWTFLNRSTGDVTVRTSTGTVLGILAPNFCAHFRVISTGAQTWASRTYLTFLSTTSTIANNTTSGTVTSLLIDGSRFRSFTAEYWVYRTTNTNEVAESGTISGIFKTTASTWEIGVGNVVGDAEIDFAITAGGQVQYTSSNLAGASYAGNMKWTIKTTLRV